ncbi:protein DA1 [Tengunoibacter tsumagoiensis]|uniref:LIM zinc-binding domain-containing protein n=1 Tax=Tengunoibacter tsumagoiensis TaxID=2014871 RepID=A0A401ZXI9_9CHLR|nr:protein DA1 [Tengunoibacter tsumagoiensis]GCE11560.1 hypothetical protein KTT_14190 [Tengunoibacter tsumagoiensis]
MQATTPICKQCGQPIQGRYITALNATWHPQHFVCAACQRPFEGESFMVHNDAPYHQTCYQNTILPRCAACGQPLSGKYVIDPRTNSSYHESCYQNTVVPRCTYCNKPLMGEFLVDQWGNKFCQEHKQQFPACQFCGRLIPPAQQEHGSDLQRCQICRSTAIEEISIARPLFGQVVRWMNGQGLLYHNQPISLELCDRVKLSERLKERHDPHSLGVTMSTTYTRNGQYLKTDIDGVSVLHGMPSVLFQGVTAHELGHVWLIVHEVRGLPSWAEEGFCELLAYRYYGGQSGAESAYFAKNIEQNRDPVYGDGFRRVKAIADREGFARFLSNLQTTKKM